MKKFDYTTPKVAPSLEDERPKQEDKVGLPQTMLEAIEHERQMAIQEEINRHEAVLVLIKEKFDALKHTEEEREKVIQEAQKKAQDDLDEIDSLILERRSTIYSDVKRIAEEFEERFTENTASQ